MTDIANIVDRVKRDYLEPPGRQAPLFIIQNAVGTPITSVTGSSSDDVIAKTAHGLSNGDKIIFTAITGGTGLATYTTYYVVSATTNTFQVALESGGTALTFADFSAATIVELSALSSTSRRVVVNTANLSTEEEDLLAAGTLLEIESEVVRIAAISGTSPSFTLTLDRAKLGTSAAAHADGVDVYLITEDHVSRLSIFNAVADSIEALWPDLWTTGTEESGFTLEPIELPAYAGEVVNVQVSYGGQWREVGSWTELDAFPYVSSGRAVQIHGIADGTEIIIYYKKIPQRPTAESNTWADLYVESNWIRVITISAVAELMARFDLSNFDTEFITQMLRAETRSPGEGTDLRNALLQLRSFLITPLLRAQRRTPNDRLIIDKTY